MRKNMVLMISLLIVATGPHLAAQFPIKIPKIKIEKPKSGQSSSGDAGAGGYRRSTGGSPSVGNPSGSLGSADGPTIAKDSIQIRAFTFSAFKNNSDVWSWVPDVKFSVNGPVAGGSRLVAEFTAPGGAPWLKIDCAAEQTPPGSSMKTACGGRQISEDKGITYTGPVSFSIKLANELAGSEI